VVDRLFSPGNFISENINRLKNMMEEYHNGMVFFHDDLIYFILNQHKNIRSLCSSIYLFIRKKIMFDIPVYFYISNIAINVKELQKKLIDGAHQVKYAFFNRQTKVLFEDFIEERKGNAPDTNIDKAIRQIQYDIRERDLKCLVKDLNNLFLVSLKNKMDFEAFDYTCDRLGQIYGDIVTLNSLNDTMVFSITNDSYIEESAQKIIIYYEHLYRTIYPEMENNPLIQDALSYIRKNFYNSISLTDLSSHLKLSTSYISGLFKQVTKTNFSDYLLNIRIQRAKDYLLEGGYKIYEVAEMAGFQGVKYFSSMFKESTGLTPREYQKIMLVKSLEGKE
jgi:two-component system response regulator YesN